MTEFLEIKFCDIELDVTLDRDNNPTHIWPSDVNHTGGNLLPMIEECFSPECKLFLRSCIDNAIKCSVEMRIKEDNERLNNYFNTN